MLTKNIPNFLPSVYIISNRFYTTVGLKITFWCNVKIVIIYVCFMYSSILQVKLFTHSFAISLIASLIQKIVLSAIVLKPQ